MNKTLKKIEEFHGHLGPYVVIGYKMGLIANRILGENPFSKKTEVWTDLNPPASCIIDGIQISSGCTMGKGNIKVNYGKIAKAKFINKNGEKVIVTLKPEIIKDIDTNLKDENITFFSERLFSKKDYELFEILR